MQYKKDDVVVYGNYGICIIKDIRFTSFSPDKPKEKYFVLASPESSNSIYYVPVSVADSILRAPMTNQEIEKLLSSSLNKDMEYPENRQARSDIFHKILSDGISEELILLLRHLHRKKLEASANNKCLSATEEVIYSQACKLVCNEFSYSLNLPSEKVIDLLLSYPVR